MKRLLIQILVMAVLCIGWSCCPQAAALEKEEKNVEEQVNEILTGMSTEQKLAQMMIITLRSDMQGTKCVTQLDPSYEDLLEKYDFGGLILFAGNIMDTEQTVTLIHD